MKIKLLKFQNKWWFTKTQKCLFFVQKNWLRGRTIRNLIYREMHENRAKFTLVPSSRFTDFLRLRMTAAKKTEFRTVNFSLSNLATCSKICYVWKWKQMFPGSPSGYSEWAQLNKNKVFRFNKKSSSGKSENAKIRTY